MNCKTEIPEGCAFVTLRCGAVALVDAEDAVELNKRSWFLNTGYAVAVTRAGGRQRLIYMHRVVNGTPDGMDTDHINGIRLDNRRCNLRNATRQQNCYNKPNEPGSEVPYKGVSKNVKLSRFATPATCFRATISVNGRRVHLGNFKCAKDAAIAYDNAARSLHGEFARLNFP